jgi:DNA-binding transcriptional regulator of glucitol operon
VGRFFAPRWLARHALMVALVTAFLLLGWWQFSRAREGNMLSYAYAVEWPVFAAFVVFVWVKEIRDELGRETSAPPTTEVPDELVRMPGYVPFQVPTGPRPTGGDGSDPELVAYNRYLEWLAANPGRRPSEYRPTEG